MVAKDIGSSAKTIVFASINGVSKNVVVLEIYLKEAKLSH